MRCEHAFVSIKGSPYAYSRRRTLETRNLAIVLPAAAELAHIGLSDALAILELMARDGDPTSRRPPHALDRPVTHRDTAHDAQGSAMGHSDGRAATEMPGVAARAGPSTLTVGPSVAP
jgi:hypothetical protein